MRVFCGVLLALCVVAAMPVRAASGEAAALGLHLRSCVQGHAKVPAACGTFGVYENRAARSGRIISLRLVVLKAKHPGRRAIALLAGGPGQSAVSLAPLIADGVFEKGLEVLRDRYDIVFVDSRGTGGSHPFDCDLAPAAHPYYYFRQLWPDELVAACRAKSAKRSNPNFYNNSNAVDDLNEVRGALGYPRLVLHGSSDGTFAALIFIRRYSDRVESAILNGVDPPHFQPLPGAPAGVQAAMDDLIAKCRNDAVCKEHFPQFAQHFNALVHRFDRGPIRVKVKNSETKRFDTVLLSKEVFVDRLRQGLYQSENAAYVPYLVERAYHMDYVPLGDMIDGMTQALAHALDAGAFLSYSCSEWMPFVSEDELKAAAAHSFAGDVRVRAQRRACAIWKVKAMPSNFNDPVRSSVPVLMISGSDDPATPPRYAEAALAYLPNAKEVLVRGAGHSAELPCTNRLIVQFVRAQSAKALDVSQCRAAFSPPHFATSGG